ncbi:MAG: hypothetical protein H4O13_18185 [Xanthomonadales bacterium]|nr:hypothetical protein [Xanthomonadales bacterium]
MNPLDLDTLRGRWADQGRALDQRLHLDLAAVRAQLDRRTASAFRRHRGWLIAGLALAVPMSLGLLVFIASHWGQWAWVLMGVALLALAFGEVLVGLSEWLALRRLDLSAPSVELQQRLDRLQSRRQRQTRLLLSCSLLLWLPLLAVLLKGLFGGDLLRGLPASVWWVNLGLGLAFIPLSLGAAAWWRRRFATSTRSARAGDGDSWTRARVELDARLAFDLDAERDPEAALQSQTLPDDLRADVAALRRRLLLGILACAAGLVAIGLFHAAHAGLPQFIVPGVLINLWLVAQLAPTIQLRLALNPLPGGLPAFRARLASALQLRRRFAIGGVIGLPLMVLMLVQVVVQTASAVDLVAALGAPASGALLGFAAIFTALLVLQARRGAKRMSAWADALSGFALVRGEALLSCSRVPD